MAQIFHRSTNFISKFSVFAGAFLAGIALTGVMFAARTPYLTNQNVTRDQPIQFSHSNGRCAADQDVHELPFGAV
jgi:hypothetical protein